MVRCDNLNPNNKRERSRTIGCVSVCDVEPTASMLPLDELLGGGSVIGEIDQDNELTSKRQRQQATISSNRRTIKPRAMLEDIYLDPCSKLDDITNQLLVMWLVGWLVRPRETHSKGPQQHAKPDHKHDAMRCDAMRCDAMGWQGEGRELEAP